MKRFQSILVVLAAATVTLPVQAARPQLANRGGAGGVARQSVPQRRTVSPVPGTGYGATRSPAKSIPSHVLPTRRPTDAMAGKKSGGRVSPIQPSGRLPVDPILDEVPMPRPGNSRPRPNSIERPGLEVSYEQGPAIQKPNNNNGGGNNGGGGRHPHPGRRPCHGPTGWDLLAIGLATAAFADGGGLQSSCYASDCVTVGQPTCCAATSVVESQVELQETSADDAFPSAVQSSADAGALPQLRVGEPFKLPAKGLGTEQGSVGVKIGAAILDCRVTAWNDAGLVATLPDMTLASRVKAELIVAFADGTMALAMPVELLPAQASASK